MANVNVVWSLPVTRESGKPLNVSDIDRVEIEISADAGANFGLVGKFGTDVTSTLLEAVDVGDWIVRGTVYDKAGRQSKPLLASFSIADTTPPSALQTLQVTLA